VKRIACLLLSLSGCAATAATDTATYVPPSTVIVRAANALGGLSCGEGDDQVYKYVATLVPEKAGTSRVRVLNDCFADTFLVPAEGPVLVTILGYAKVGYEAQREIIGAAIRDSSDLSSERAVIKRRCTGTRLANVQTVLSCAPEAGSP
jgi:hypothetical protein